MRTLTLISLLMVVGLTPPGDLSAQADDPLSTSTGTECEGGFLELDRVDGTFADVARLAEITGRAASRPGFVRRRSHAPAVAICGGLPWERRLTRMAPGERRSLRVLPVRSRAVVNTGYAIDRNDGALRAGRGLSAALSGGLELRWGVFSAAAAPELLYQANGDYPTSGVSRQDIDWPAHIGTTDVALIDPGQSYARVDAYGAAVGVSTENLWLGPGLESSALLSSTAPGFPHAFAGTSRPVDIRIGRLDAEAFLGRLEESRFFDENEDNDHRLITGLVMGFEPHATPGLQLGAGRLVQRYTDSDAGAGAGADAGDGAGDGAGAGTGDDASTDDTDRLISLYFRWILPESGFEVFGEWARYDESSNLHDLVVEPESGRTYLVGLQKVFDLGARWVRVHGEIANLNPTLAIMDRATTRGVYRHAVIRQGHTHRGQLLGAWTGPASDYQVVGGDLLGAWGSVGVFGRRVRRNVDIYFSEENLRRGYPLKHDVELTGGTRATYFWRGLDLSATAAYSHRRNRDFLPPDIGEIQQGYRVDGNWNLQVGLRWRPTLERRTLMGDVRAGDQDR